MIAYLDASALVKHYVEEDGSDAVRRILGESVPVTSRLTEVELTSAIARRARQGDVSENVRDKLLGRLRQDLLSFYVVELVPEVVSQAGSLLLRHPLRANDAIQLASCLAVQARLPAAVRFVASDQRLNAAARAEGLRVETGGAFP